MRFSLFRMMNFSWDLRKIEEIEKISISQRFANSRPANGQGKIYRLRRSAFKLPSCVRKTRPYSKNKTKISRFFGHDDQFYLQSTDIRPQASFMTALISYHRREKILDAYCQSSVSIDSYIHVSQLILGLRTSPNSNFYSP